MNYIVYFFIELISAFVARCTCQTVMYFFYVLICFFNTFTNIKIILAVEKLFTNRFLHSVLLFIETAGKYYENLSLSLNSLESIKCK